MSREFVKFEIDLRMQEMKAFVMSHFTPEQIGNLYDAALADAISRFPDKLKTELDRAMSDIAKEAIYCALPTYSLKDLLKPHRADILRALAKNFNDAAERIENT